MAFFSAAYIICQKRHARTDAGTVLDRLGPEPLTGPVLTLAMIVKEEEWRESAFHGG